MRPRVFPAEDSHPRREASMRPRVFPAEDVKEPLYAAGLAALQ